MADDPEMVFLEMVCEQTVRGPIPKLMLTRPALRWVCAKCKKLDTYREIVRLTRI